MSASDASNLNTHESTTARGMMDESTATVVLNINGNQVCAVPVPSSGGTISVNMTVTVAVEADDERSLHMRRRVAYPTPPSAVSRGSRGSGS